MDNSIIEQDCRSISEKIDLSRLNHKSILLTGATGLIGTYILFTISSFVKGGGKPEKLYLVTHRSLPEHLEEFRQYPWVEILTGDLCDTDFCSCLPCCDYMIHAACYGQPGKFLEEPEKTLKLNTLTTFFLLEHLKSGGHFLFISTSELYSGNKNLPYKETEIGNTNTNHPRSCYIEGKRCGEAICNAYRAKGIDAKSARLCLAYGPGVSKNDRRVLYNLIAKALKSGRIELLDSGSAMRTYCYVQDAVELILDIMLFGKDEVYNVGGHSKTSILNLAELIGNLLEVDVDVPQTGHTLTGAPLNVELDMTKCEREFQKHDYIDLQDGLIRTIGWFQNY